MWAWRRRMSIRSPGVRVRLRSLPASRTAASYTLASSSLFMAILVVTVNIFHVKISSFFGLFFSSNMRNITRPAPIRTLPVLSVNICQLSSVCPITWNLYRSTIGSGVLSCNHDPWQDVGQRAEHTREQVCRQGQGQEQGHQEGCAPGLSPSPSARVSQPPSAALLSPLNTS